VDNQTQENRIRLLLLAGQALFRASLSRLLAAEHSLEWWACAVIRRSSRHLEGFRDRRGSGGLGRRTEARDGFLSASRSQGYQGRFLIITGAAEAGNPTAAIKLGASGIFLKSEAPDRLIQAITLVANGAVWLEQKTLRLLADQSVARLAPNGSPRSGISLPIGNKECS